MNKKILIASSLLIILVIIFGIVIFHQKQPKTKLTQNSIPVTKSFSISSPVFDQNGMIPKQYTCDGNNISPPLTIRNVPSGTKSLLLLIDDIDTPQATWVHWLVWNIPSKTKEIVVNSLPAGAVVGLNSYGNNAYGGPCPPTGQHRYVFRLYALDTLLVISAQSHKQDALDAANTHVLAETEYTGVYSH